MAAVARSAPLASLSRTEDVASTSFLGERLWPSANAKARNHTSQPIHQSVRVIAGTRLVKGGKTTAERKSQASSALATKDDPKPSFFSRLYVNITGFPFPLAPVFERPTVRKEIKRGEIWTFEQPQGLSNGPTANVRMTIIKLQSGGLWVHAPIAPTAECLQLVKELDAPVEYIVLPTFAYEHKIFVGPFSRAFPKAKVVVPPGLWSYPLNLPNAFFGIFKSSTVEDGLGNVWGPEIDAKLFVGEQSSIGPYIETAFFHKSSRTLLVTDCCVVVPRNPPEVVSVKSLLASAEDNFAVRVASGGKTRGVGKITDTPEDRDLGWQRMVLQILYFGPSNLLEPERSFNSIAGKLLVSPVVRTLVFNKVAEDLCDWVDAICRDWSFSQIIPCHFSAPIKAGPREFKAAFTFAYDIRRANSLEQGVVAGNGLPKLTLPPLWPFGESSNKVGSDGVLPEDLATLNSLDDALVNLGAVKKTRK